MIVYIVVLILLFIDDVYTLGVAYYKFAYFLSTPFQV